MTLYGPMKKWRLFLTNEYKVSFLEMTSWASKLSHRSLVHPGLIRSRPSKLKWIICKFKLATLMCKQAIKLDIITLRRSEANIRAWLSAILNTFLWRLEDWFWSCDVIGLESLGFCRPYDNDKPAFRFATFCTANSKVSVFGNRIHRLCVNGRSKRREKNAFL